RLEVAVRVLGGSRRRARQRDDRNGERDPGSMAQDERLHRRDLPSGMCLPPTANGAALGKERSVRSRGGDRTATRIADGGAVTAVSRHGDSVWSHGRATISPGLAAASADPQKTTGAL